MRLGLSGRDLQLSQRFLVALLTSKGWSPQNIGRFGRLRRSFVNKWRKRVRNGEGLSDRPRSGRPRKLDTAEQQKVLNKLVTEHKTVRQVAEEIKTEAGPSVVHATIVNTAHRHGYVAKKRPRKTLLTEDHKRQRLKFAKAMLKKPSLLRTLCVTDESHMLLSGKRSRMHTRQWVKRDQKPEPLEILKSRTSVQVWGGITPVGKLPLIFYKGKLNGVRYRREILEKAVPDADALFRKHHIRKWTFQQDGAPCHGTQENIQYLIDNKVFHISGGKWAKWKWPPNSPDLSPIENLWAIMQDSLYKNPPKTEKELRHAIQAQWDAVSAETLETLFASMPKRLQECVDNNGGLTEY